MTEPTQGDASNHEAPGTTPPAGTPPTGQPPAGNPLAPQGAPAPPPYGSGQPMPPQGGGPGAPGSPPYPGAGVSDPNKPGSKAWVEQRYGRTAEFSERVLPGIVDAAISFAAAFIPLVLGLVLIIAGMPDTYECGSYPYTSDCEVLGSGSDAMVVIGVLLILLTFFISLAVAFWNRVWRVTKSGQSIGKKINGLKVIDAETGGNPQLGPAVLRELVHQFAGIISWIWMLIDDDDRTLADIVGKTHVVHTDQS